jgi:hypothetical protein
MDIMATKKATPLSTTTECTAAEQDPHQAYIRALNRNYAPGATRKEPSSYVDTFPGILCVEEVYPPKSGTPESFPTYEAVILEDGSYSGFTRVLET